MRLLLLLFLGACHTGLAHDYVEPDGGGGQDLSYVPRCTHNSDCPTGQVCIPGHASCRVQLPGDGGFTCDDDFGPSCAPIDLDPYLRCTISGDVTICVCKSGSCE